MAAHEPEPGCSLDRRTFIKGTAGTIAATMLVSRGVEPAAAIDNGDLALGTLAATGPAGMLLAGAIYTHRTSTTAQGEALWDQIYATALEQEIVTKGALGSIENDAEMIKGYLRTDIAHTLVTEAQKDGTTQTEVENSMLSILEEDISDILTNLFNIWTVDLLSFLRRFNWVDMDDTGSLDHGNMFRYSVYTGAESVSSYPSDFDPVDGGPDQSEGFDRQLMSLSSVLQRLQTIVDADSDIDDPETEQDQTSLFPSGSPLTYTQEDSSGTITYNATAQIDLPNGESVVIPHAAASGRYSIFPYIPFEPNRATNVQGFQIEREQFGDLRLIDLLEGDSDAWSHIDSNDLQNVFGEIETFQRLGPDVEESDDVSAVHLDPHPYLDVYNEIMDVFTEYSGEITQLADSFYQPAADGEIEAAEVASGKALIEAAQEGDDWQAGAGYYRAGGLSESKEYVVIETDSFEGEGTLFATDRSGIELPVDEWINPEDINGEVHASVEITAVFDPAEVDVTITVVDGSGSALEGVSITILDEDVTATTDSNGQATISAIEEGAYDIELDDGTNTTPHTIEVSEDSAVFELESDGGDYTKNPQDLDTAGVGDVYVNRLSGEFKITETEGSDPLEFEESSLYTPESDPQDVTRVLTTAYDNENETRNEDETDEDSGPGPLFPGGNPLEGGGLLGLGIIGIVILAVIGIVTDAIPGLGN